MKNRIVLVLILLAGLVLAPATVEATGCGIITADTTMTEDVFNHDGTCFTIGANDITLDCNDYKIEGDSSGFDYGINFNGKSGITVKDCTINGFYYGIYVNSNNNLVQDVVANSNLGNGIFLWGDSNTLSEVTLNSNSGDGLYVFWSGSTTENTFEDITVNSNKNGINLYGSNNNEFDGIIAKSNSDHGVYLQANSDDNTFINGEINDNDDHGVRIDSTYGDNENNIFYANEFIDNNDKNAQVKDDNVVDNDWYNLLTSKGNYWSTYTGVDDGSNGRTAFDGVGDTNYPHPGTNFDEYPLVKCTSECDSVDYPTCGTGGNKDKSLTCEQELNGCYYINVPTSDCVYGCDSSTGECRDEALCQDECDSLDYPACKNKDNSYTCVEQADGCYDKITTSCEYTCNTGDGTCYLTPPCTDECVPKDYPACETGDIYQCVLNKDDNCYDKSVKEDCSSFGCEDNKCVSVLELTKCNAPHQPLTGDAILTADIKLSKRTSSPCLTIIESKKDELTLDCDGHTIEYTYSKSAPRGPGITISGSDVTLKNCEIIGFRDGIRIYGDDHIIENTISRDNRYYGVMLTADDVLFDTVTLTDNKYGIRMYKANDNEITESTIEGNSYYGAFIYNADRNVIHDSVIEDNTRYGIYVYGRGSSKNLFYDNKIVDNYGSATTYKQVYDTSYKSYWHNSVSKRGNYWSNYNGVDTNSDGIGDTKVPHYNKYNGRYGTDKYPLTVTEKNCEDSCDPKTFDKYCSGSSAVSCKMQSDGCYDENTAVCSYGCSSGVCRSLSIDEQYVTSNVRYSSTYDTTKSTRILAQSFVPDKENLEKVELYLKPYRYTGGRTLTAEIRDTIVRSDGRKIPGNTVLDKASIPAKYSTKYKWYTFDVDAELDAGKTYWIVLKDNTVSSSQYTIWPYGRSGGYSDGYMAHQKGSARWVTVSSKDRPFKVWAY